MEEYNIAIWTLNEKGLRTALRLRGVPGIKDILTPASVKKSYVNPRISGYDNFSESVCKVFREYNGHVFIMATGIVIRTISKVIKDNKSDPAIVVMDEMGKNVISLLLGNMGGANRLTLQLASLLDGNPVITTTTDITDITAVDTVAMEIGAVIENKDMIKSFSSAMLNNEPVALICDKYLYEKYYGNADYRPDHFQDIIDVNPHEYDAICIISEKQFQIPPDVLRKFLLIRPPNLVLGIGIVHNTGSEEIASTVSRILSLKGLSPLSITDVATIDKKKDEPGLLAYCNSINQELKYYDAETLNNVKYQRLSPPSQELKKNLGSYGVSEPAAILCAGKGSELIVNKITSGNVTIAIARKKME